MKGLNVIVTDIINNKTISYNAIRAAARGIGIDKRYHAPQENYLEQKNPVLDRYTFYLVDPVIYVKTHHGAKKL